MPKTARPLTERIVEDLPHTEKSTYALDASCPGLMLEVTITGKWWRYRFSRNGKTTRISLGSWPDVTLREARLRAGELLRKLQSGHDPVADRRQARTLAKVVGGETFKDVFAAWIKNRSSSWSESYTNNIQRIIERDVQPSIGNRNVADLRYRDLLPVIKKIQETGKIETSHRALRAISSTLQYAVRMEMVTADVTRGMTKDLTPRPQDHFPAPVKAEELAPVLRAMACHKGGCVVGVALQLTPYLAARPGELRQMKWKDLDLETGTWKLKVSKTKKGKEPRFLDKPLSWQALALLKALFPLTGGGEWVFPGQRKNNRPMSDAAIVAALRSVGLPPDIVVAHSFRASFRTLARERFKALPDILEHELGHVARGPLGHTYAREEFIDDRRVVMQQWADLLDELRGGPPPWIRDGGEQV
ncbi:MAG: hypothetical protein A2284_13435 [Deltaproteobacteria bacterium RIFOXYA12_FULL_61_11]|nr:MAG: hypothetical protein A2284_13435 [Deltaproteobacteria bacterium RIFOXYA12_FULL_61_11]